MIAGFEIDTARLNSLSPSGYFLALRIGFAYPMMERNTLPSDWQTHYQRGGLVMADPVMIWMYANQGAARWSELKIHDAKGIMEQARRFGLNYGVAISYQSRGSDRSFGSFARSDREFEDAEIEILESIVELLHESLVAPTNLTKAELEALEMAKNGLLMKEMANLLGISEGAIKQRLKNAKTKLKAKNSAHAASLATSYGLL